MEQVNGKYGNPIIINADDFGCSKEINEAIVRLLKANRIQRTTLMVNMPFAQDAYEMAKENGLLDKVGLHINLTDGKPLSRPILDTRFCKDGLFDVSQVEHRTRLFITRRESHAIDTEVRAQMERYKELFGSYPSHIDGHRHVHNYFAFLTVIANIAKEHNVRSMRIGINLFDKKEAGLIKKLYKWVLNSYIKRNFQHTDYMGSYLEYVNYFDGSKADTVEIMVHPSIHNGNIVDIIYNHDRQSYYDFSQIN